MKKAYSLDYTIERDIDRRDAVIQILDQLKKDPSPTELEQMASYILYGKDENGKNAVQRQETTDSDTRYKSFQRMADKNESLDELLENPLTNEAALVPIDEAPRYIYTKKRQSIKRPKHDKNGNEIDPGDGDIPGMRQLWECIDRLEHVYNVAMGKVPADPDTELITNNYKIYKLQHQLMDLRRHQYYLLDMFRPTLKFFNIQPPAPQTYDWDSDSQYWMSVDEWQRKVNNSYLNSVSKNLSDYTTRIDEKTGETQVLWVVKQHTFDWENPFHIRQLMKFYSKIAMEVHEKLYSWGRTLIFDFDRYEDMCDFSEVRQYILTRTIDGASIETIAAELPDATGYSYHISRVHTIINQEIPQAMATAARRNRLLIQTPIGERKRCFRCGRWFPRDDLFFARNAGRRDGWSSCCKECEKARRIEKKRQSTYDRRIKDAKVFEMPPDRHRV